MTSSKGRALDKEFKDARAKHRPLVGVLRYRATLIIEVSLYVHETVLGKGERYVQAPVCFIADGVVA